MNNDKVKISVIIPVYNVENYIKETLLSLINQSFRDFEVIVINDGTEDNSAEICSSILKDSNLSYKIIHKLNEGIAVARNIGIKEAKGEYIYFIDGDDYAESCLLEKFYIKAEKEHSDVVFCGYSYFDYKRKMVKEKMERYIKYPIDGDTAAEFMALNKFWISGGSGFYRKSFIKESNIEFPSDVHLGESTVFIFKALMHSKVVSCVNENLIYFIKRDSSVTKMANERIFDLHKANIYIINYNDFHRKNPKIKDALVNYRIPSTIIKIYLVLVSNSVYKKELLEFSKREDIRWYLKGFKPQHIKGNIEFKIVAWMIIINGNMSYKIIHRIKKLFKKNKGRA